MDKQPSRMQRKINIRSWAKWTTIFGRDLKITYIPFQFSFYFQITCNTFICNAQVFLQGMTNTLGLAFSVGDTTPWFTISIEQDN